MLNDNEAQRLVDIICKHFSQRKDFYHVVTGPKRETWFNAECISALAQAQDADLSKSFVVHGELSYSTIYRELLQNGTSQEPSKGDGRKVPDVFGYSHNNGNIAFIIEAKLIDELDDKKSQSSLIELQQQLETANSVLPNATVLGIIFAVHHISRPVSKKKDNNGAPIYTAVKPESFYTWVTQQMNNHLKFPPSR